MIHGSNVGDGKAMLVNVEQRAVSGLAQSGHGGSETRIPVRRSPSNASPPATRALMRRPTRPWPLFSERYVRRRLVVYLLAGHCADVWL